MVLLSQCLTKVYTMSITAMKKTTEVSEPAYSFYQPEEKQLVEEFLANGIVRVEAEDKTALDAIRDFLANKAASILSLDKPADPAHFLNNIHQHVSVDQLNDFRVMLIGGMRDESWLRPAYFSIARKAVETIVGNELVMQRNVNLSIQLPDDSSSLLPVHSDVWSGDSPYEVVLWVPYVDCFKTKSMYFCNANKDEELQRRMADYKHYTAEDLYHIIEKDVTFMDVPYGHVLLFTQNIMHGNRINVEGEARWSSNCRFKSALSPFADKKLGEFFEPITIRPATRMGLRYQLPTGFDQ